MTKKLIATDYDGTINRGGIAPDDLAAIAEWRAAGGLFGVVTGRGTDFFRTAEENGLKVDFHIVYNGALLALPDGTVIREYLIPRPVFAAIGDFFGKLPDAVSFNEADEREFYHHYYATMPTQERALEVARDVNALFGGDVTAFVNGEHVNIGKKGSSKTQGVFDALEYFGLPRDAAAVFGDDYNDIDMITTHGGWAVSTARPAVLEIAPHVCRSVGEAARELMK